MNFFSRARKVLVPGFDLVHNAAWAFCNAETYSSFRLGRTEDDEAWRRAAVLCGALILGSVLATTAEPLYQKIKDQCCSADHEDTNEPEDEESTCCTYWKTIKPMIDNFRTGFCLSAGPAMMSYAFFPKLKLNALQTNITLTCLSTFGGFVGIGFSFYCYMTESSSDEITSDLSTSQTV